MRNDILPTATTTNTTSGINACVATMTMILIDDDAAAIGCKYTKCGFGGAIVDE